MLNEGEGEGGLLQNVMQWGEHGGGRLLASVRDSPPQ